MGRGGPVPYRRYIGGGPQALCVLALICYGASRTPGYTGLAICELVFAALLLALWGCGLAPRLPLVHWGWTVSAPRRGAARGGGCEGRGHLRGLRGEFGGSLVGTGGSLGGTWGAQRWFGGHRGIFGGHLGGSEGSSGGTGGGWGVFGGT